MDPDLVRLILVVLGILLVAGIYLWDRYRRSVPRFRMPRRSPSSISIDPETLEANPSARAEPTIGEAVESIPEMRLDDSPNDVEIAIDVPRTRSELDPDPSDLGEWSGAGRDQDPQFSMDLNFDAHGDGDYLSTDPALYDEVERKLVVINLVMRGGTFSGVAIEKACSAVNLVLGDMSIYHRHDGSNGRVMFSMASMLEPGNFPSDGMAGFATPGLSLFTQLPGVRDGVEIYEEMLSTAKQLASLLHAELQDQEHNKLTRQMQEHTRESIIEHRRKLNLVRGRR
ncbi:MAG: cell division protein ZipA C-terminal FtsZ-binding domain-containing protein [Sedimenticolaceae bacterium]